MNIEEVRASITATTLAPLAPHTRIIIFALCDEIERLQTDQKEEKLIIIKSKFQGLVVYFKFEWTCSHCTSSQTVEIKSPFTQKAICHCTSCGTRYDVQIDMEGCGRKRQEIIEKIGAAVLKDLVPGY